MESEAQKVAVVTSSSGPQGEITALVPEQNPWDCAFELVGRKGTAVQRLSLKQALAYLRDGHEGGIKELLVRGLKKAAYVCIERGNTQAGCYYIWQIVSHTADTEERVEYLLWLGSELEYGDRNVDAVACYRRARELKPRNSKLRYLINYRLAHCLNGLGKHQQAEECCHEAIASGLNRHEAWYELGVVLFGQERYAESAEKFSRVLVAQPEHEHALWFFRILRQRCPELLGRKRRWFGGKVGNAAL